MDFFDFFSVFLNSPCYETPRKRVKKKQLKKNGVSNYFPFSAAANVRHFRLFCLRPPLVSTGHRHSSPLPWLLEHRAQSTEHITSPLNQRPTPSRRGGFSACSPSAPPAISCYLVCCLAAHHNPVRAACSSACYRAFS
jgi:hypothetical protein